MDQLILRFHKHFEENYYLQLETHQTRNLTSE